MNIIKVTKKDIKYILSFNFGPNDKIIQVDQAMPSYLHPNPLVRWLFWKRLECISDLLKISKDARVLDFGCGLGTFLPTLCNISKNVYALDLYPQYAKELVKYKRINVTFLKDINEIDDGFFDAIIAADVLEHLEYPKTIVSTFKHKLRQGGDLIVSGPTENILYKICRFFAWNFNQTPEGYTIRETHLTNIDILKKIIKQSGFILKAERPIPIPCLFPLFKILSFK